MNSDTTKELSVKEMLVKLLTTKEEKEATVGKIPIKAKKGFTWPKLWMKKIENNAEARDTAVVLYFNQKGIIEEPRVINIEAGNIVMIKGSPYEVDPRAFWLIKIGKNVHKILCIKEIDRRPISNLDIDEVRERGDSTDSDSFLIKAALKEQIGAAKKPIPSWLIWVIGIVVLGAIGFFLFQSGGAAPDPSAILP